MKTEGPEDESWSPSPVELKRGAGTQAKVTHRRQEQNSPGEVGGEGEARVDGRPKIKILGAREAGDVQAERSLAARGQETWRATELRGRAG